MTLEEWRGRFREQQVAFRLAREVVRRWQAAQSAPSADDGDALPAQTLFPHVVSAARRLLADCTKLVCKGGSQPVDVLLVNKYAQTAVDNLFEAVRRGKRTEQTELPRIPYCKHGVPASYLPDFIAVLVGGSVPADRDQGTVRGRCGPEGQGREALGGGAEARRRIRHLASRSGDGPAGVDDAPRRRVDGLIEPTPSSRGPKPDATTGSCLVTQTKRPRRARSEPRVTLWVRRGDENGVDPGHTTRIHAALTC